MLAKQFAIVSLLGLSTTSPVLAQGSNNHSPKLSPKNSATAGPTAETGTDAPTDKPKDQSLRRDNLHALTITDANGIRRTVAEEVDGNGKRSVRFFVDNDGTRYRRSKNDKHAWSTFDKNGKPAGDFHGNVELINGRDIRVTKTAFNQVLLYRLDGSWEWELSTEDVLPRGDDRQPERRKRFTIRHFTDSTAELVDHAIGQTYSTDAFHDQSLLKRDPKSGALSFINWNNYLITIQTDDDPDTSYSEQGKRTIRTQAGVGPHRPGQVMHAVFAPGPNVS